MSITKLENTIIGKGEVSGYVYVKMFENENGYVYEVSNGSKRYYEAFKKKLVKVCIDFEKRIYSETEKKEVYPKSNAFGNWAWTVDSVEKGIKLINK